MECSARRWEALAGIHVPTDAMEEGKIAFARQQAWIARCQAVYAVSLWSPVLSAAIAMSAESQSARPPPATQQLPIRHTNTLASTLIASSINTLLGTGGAEGADSEDLVDEGWREIESDSSLDEE